MISKIHPARRSVLFEKYFQWSLKFYDCDPALFLMNYIHDRMELNMEQRYWIAWLYGNTYQLATAWVIANEFPDFENVVSKENVEILRIRKPFLAKLLSESSDTYSKAVEAYQAIKDLGIHRTQVMDQDHARAIKNATKPRPLTSVNPQQGDSPLSTANAFANGEFTAEMKTQLLREMNQIRKNN